MSTNPHDQNDDGDDGSDAHVTIPRANIRALEKKANAGAEAQVKLAALERELAFRDAGINPADPKLKYFAKGYDGDVSVEAIRTAAIEAGFLEQQQSGPPQQPQFQIPPSELYAMQQANATTAGLQTAPTSATSEAAYFAALQQAKSADEVMAVARKFGIPTPGFE